MALINMSDPEEFSFFGAARKRFSSLSSADRLARALLAAPLLYFAYYKVANWQAVVSWMEYKSLILPDLFLTLAVVVESAGATFVMLRMFDKFNGIVVCVYLILVSVFMHNFWAAEGQQKQPEIENFLKGVMLAGAFLLIAIQPKVISPSRARGAKGADGAVLTNR